MAITLERGAAEGPLPAFARAGTGRYGASRRALSCVALSLIPLLSGCHQETQEISVGSCGGSGLQVRVTPTSVRSAAVFFNGTRNASCCRDLVCVGKPDVTLGEIAWVEDGCSGRELAVFAPGFEPQRRAFPDPIPDRVELRSPRVVLVKLWVVAEGAEIEAIVERGTEDVMVAAERLDALASGVRLRLADAVGIPSDGTAPSRASAIGNRCDMIAASLLAAAETTRRQYYASPDTVNVYYVADVAADCPATNPDCYGSKGSMGKGWLHGLSCASDDPANRRKPEILYVSGKLASRAETLLHELGHSLGLVRPAWGHTNGLEDFPERARNLMYDGANTVEGITIGQLWRLHYEPTSWLFPAGTTAGFDACQLNPRDDVPCPPLALRPSQPWP